MKGFYNWLALALFTVSNLMKICAIVALCFVQAKHRDGPHKYINHEEHHELAHDSEHNVQTKKLKSTNHKPVH